MQQKRRTSGDCIKCKNQVAADRNREELHNRFVNILQPCASLQHCCVNLNSYPKVRHFASDSYECSLMRDAIVCVLVWPVYVYQCVTLVVVFVTLSSSPPCFRLSLRRPGSAAAALPHCSIPLRSPPPSSPHVSPSPPSYGVAGRRCFPRPACDDCDLRCVVCTFPPTGRTAALRLRRRRPGRGRLRRCVCPTPPAHVTPLRTLHDHAASSSLSHTAVVRSVAASRGAWTLPAATPIQHPSRRKTIGHRTRQEPTSGGRRIQTHEVRKTGAKATHDDAQTEATTSGNLRLSRNPLDSYHSDTESEGSAVDGATIAQPMIVFETASAAHTNLRPLRRLSDPNSFLLRPAAHSYPHSIHGRSRA